MRHGAMHGVVWCGVVWWRGWYGVCVVVGSREVQAGWERAREILHTSVGAAGLVLWVKVKVKVNIKVKVKVKRGHVVPSSLN